MIKKKKTSLIMLRKQYEIVWNDVFERGTLAYPGISKFTREEMCIDIASEGTKKSQERCRHRTE